MRAKMRQGAANPYTQVNVNLKQQES